MAIKSGFFDFMLQGGKPDREYSTEDFGLLFDGLIRDGVFEHVGDCFAVHAVEGEMAVHVGTGKSWFNRRWMVNDSIFRVDIEPAYDLLNRYDSIVIEVNDQVDVRACTIKVLKGTGATDPDAPELTNTNYIHQYRIADIYIAADTDVVTDDNIIYYVGMDETPYVSAPLEIVSSTEHWQRWYAELEDFTNDQEATFNTWFQTIQDILDENVAAHLQNEINDINGELDDIYAINSFPLAAADWTPNTDPSTSERLPYKIFIQTSVFTVGEPDWRIDGVNGIPTSEEYDAIVSIQDSDFAPTGVTLYATEEISVPLVLVTKGV